LCPAHFAGDNSLKQLAEILKAAQSKLTRDDIAALDAASVTD